MFSNLPRAVVAALLVPMLSGPVAAVQHGTQTIDAGGLKFQAPASWKSNPPSNQMRRAELVIPAANGDKEPAQVVVTAFPGGGGGVAANVARWEGQFKDSSGQSPKAQSSKVSAKQGTEVVRVELAGTYTEPTFGQGTPTPKPNYRMIGAIVETPALAYFIKITGPEATMKQATAAIDAMIRSIEVAK